MKIKSYSILLIPSFLIFSVLMTNTISAQTVLTKAEAVKIMLENNHNIIIAKNNLKVAQTNTKRELNGYMPTVDATARANSSFGGSSQKFGTGQEATVSNAFNWGTSASVSANYTLMNKTRDISLEQLKQVATLSDLQVRQTIENNLFQALNNYYEIARLMANKSTLEETIEVSKKRLERATYQFQYGQQNRLIVLNAEVDIQRDSINLLNIENQIGTAKRNLNVTIGRDVNTEFEVETEVEYDATLVLENLIQSAKENNVLMAIINQNLNISAYDFDIIESSKKPTIGAAASYDFSFSDNATGSFIDVSNSRGLNAAVSLNWNLYDGGRRKVQKEIATLNVEMQRTQRQQIEAQLERDITNAWNNYQNAFFILKAETKNKATSQINFDYTQEQFKTGKVSSIEFRQAQLNLLNAATSYNTAKFNAKIIEVQLIQLSGKLLE